MPTVTFAGNPTDGYKWLVAIPGQFAEMSKPFATSQECQDDFFKSLGARKLQLKRQVDYCRVFELEAAPAR
jgi:hypothetical protein